VLFLCSITARSAQRRGGQGANANAPATSTRPNRIIGRIVGPTGLAEKSVILSLLQDDDSRFGKLVHMVNAQLRVVPNERGEYSIDIAPGSYYVVAIPVHEPFQPNGRPTTNGFSVTYFPSATDVAAAQHVTVTMTKPVVANITLRASKLFTVTGNAKWSNGLPAATGRLGISSDGHLFGLDGRAVALQRDGTFQIGALAPGRYCLQHAEQPGSREQRRLVSAARITVIDRDLAGVRVVPVVPIAVKGRVVLAASDRPKLKSVAITVGTSPAVGGCYFGASRSGTVEPTGAFEFFVEPIDGYIRVRVNGQEVRPLAVRHNGVDVPNGRFRFSGTRPMTGVEVELGPLPRS
jgi:hypothetical protein